MVRRAALIVLLALSGACGDGDVASPQRIALDAAQARWTSTRPASNSYSIDQQVQCFCATGGVVFRVSVTNGAIARVRNLQNGTDVPTAEHVRYRSVDQLFDEVRNALRSANVLTAVSYDATMGFPTRVSLDPLKQAVDDEVSYVTSNFVAAP